MILCWEKIWKEKTLLELHLATVVKDNKKWFKKYINRKKRAKKNVHSLLDVEGNIVTKDEEKAEVLNVFLASVLNSKMCYPQGSQPPELAYRDGEQNRFPTIQDVVSDLLCHLDTQKSMVPDGSTRRYWQKSSPKYFQLFSITLGSLVWSQVTEDSKCDAHL